MLITLSREWVEFNAPLDTIQVISEAENITLSHFRARVLKAVKQVNGKGHNSTPRHIKTP